VSVTGFLRSFVMAAAWLAAAAVIALGGAGIVATANHLPGTTARAELTAKGDQAVGPALDAATAQLQGLADGVDGLSATARTALTQMVAGDVSSLQASVATGTQQLADVQAQAASLEAALGSIPYMGDDSGLQVSGNMRSRHDQLSATSGVTSGLEQAWTGFTGQALDAASLTGLLTLHDQQTAAAVKEGAAGHYPQALKLLDESDATIARSRVLQDRLAGHTDVSTLGAWLDRNAAYDAAVRTLYGAMVASRGRVTKDVRAAFQGEAAAREALPKDTRALVVIMSDIAEGGLNQAVIAIEGARGSLSDALDVQHQLQQQVVMPE
jgi:hypothetical protein